MQREQSFPISCAAVAALATLVYGGGVGARTDRAARPGNGVSPCPEGAEMLRWQERGLHRTLVASPAEPLRPSPAASSSRLPKPGCPGAPVPGDGDDDGDDGDDDGHDGEMSQNSPGVPRRFSHFQQQFSYFCLNPEGFQLRSPRKLKVQSKEERDWKLAFGVAELRIPHSGVCVATPLDARPWTNTAICWPLARTTATRCESGLRVDH